MDVSAKDPDPLTWQFDRRKGNHKQRQENANSVENDSGWEIEIPQAPSGASSGCF